MSNPNDQLLAKLLTSATEVERIADIVDDKQYVFDFLNATKAMGEDGFIVAATVSTYPALLTGNGAMAVGYLGPCGANSPHVHPRASEIQLIIMGGPVLTNMIMENGARVVKNVVPVGSATMFPKGSIHFQQSLSCSPTIFVASFDYYDPGTSQIADNFLSLDRGVVNATLGEVGVEFLNHLKLPKNVILGAQECLDRCHIDRNTFNFTKSFGDFALFTNSSWTLPSELPPSVYSSYMSSPTGSAQKLAENLAQDSSTIPFAQNPLKDVVIGLSAGVGVLMLIILGLLIRSCFGRRYRRISAQPVPIIGSYSTPYDDTETMTERYHTKA